MARRSRSEHDLVQATRNRVATARQLADIQGQTLLDDPSTNPDLHQLRLRLSRVRQERMLRRDERAARRAERRDDAEELLAARGRRLLARRRLAESPARRAALLGRLQAGVLVAALPAIAGLGLTSTAAVHAAMVDYAGAAAWAAWGMEPALMVLVAGIIITRALLLMAGARESELSGRLTAIEFGALATSVTLAWLGAGVGAAIAPIGAAVVAMAVEEILRAIRSVSGRLAAADTGAGAPGPQARSAAAAAPRAAVRPGPGWVQAPDGAALLPIVPLGSAPLPAPSEAELIAEAVRTAVREELEAPPPAPPRPQDLAPMEESDRVPGVPEVDGSWTLEAVHEAAAADGIERIEDYLAQLGRMGDVLGDTPSREVSRPWAQAPPDAAGEPENGARAGQGRTGAGRAEQDGGTPETPEPDARARVRDALSRSPKASVREVAEAAEISRSQAHRLMREVRAEAERDSARDTGRDGRPGAGGE